MKKKFIAVLSGVTICLSAVTACGAQDAVDGENMTEVSEIDETTQMEEMTQVSENEQGSETEESEESEEMTQVSENESEISKVGWLEETSEEFYGGEDNGVVIGTLAMNRLVIDDAFAGAEKINAYLSEEMEFRRKEFENMVNEDAEFLAEEDNMQYTYDSSVSGLQYFDGRYVSFIQDNYEYFGGAHGMPIWEGYTFDLETGERLYLSDLLSNTEEELKEIVTWYFGEMIDAAELSFYWENAKEIVYETFTLDSVDFVLTDEGICFFTAPYNIAAYAAGYQQVTVPYSEFEMEIEIGD